MSHSRYKAPLALNEYYHIYNLGNNSQSIVMDTKDYARLLFSLLHFQSPHHIDHPSEYVKSYLHDGFFSTSEVAQQKVIKDRFVELVAFCIMPNHFHAIVKESEEGGISKYMQKVQNGYTKYFNTIHVQKGHVFGGAFNRVHIVTNEQLLYLSAYIHKNPKALSGWRNKEDQYLWSSYTDYVHKNRWGDLLCQDILLGQFDELPEEFEKMTNESGAKDLEKHLDGSKK